MEGNGDSDQDRPLPGENSAAEGDAERTRYSSRMEGGGGVYGEAACCSMMRCASQSSLDECSQRAGGGAAAAAGAGADGAGAGAGAGAGGDACGIAVHAHSAQLLAALSSLRANAALCDVQLHAAGAPLDVPPDWDRGGDGDGDGDGDGEPAAAEPDGAAGPAAEAEPASEPVHAHRAVLAASSPYFRAMFTQFEERTQQTVTIQNIDQQALAAVVDYVYCPASLVVTEASVQRLLSAASLLAVAGVRAACGAFLTRCLAPDNALGIRAFAELHGCAELAAAAARYADAHAPQVMQSEEFLSLDAAALARFLSSDRLAAGGEEAVLDAVMRWAEHGGEPRRAQLATVMEAVRLPLMPRETLVLRAGAEPLASADVRVKDLVIEALTYHLMRPDLRASAAQSCVRARPRRGVDAAPRLLLAVGGQAPKAIREVEALHLECGRWRSVAELPARRCRAGLAVLGGRAYAVGGFNGTLRVRSVDVYDAAADAWTAGPPLAARRSTLGVAVVDGRIYAVGGFDGVTGLSSAEVLDVAGGALGWRPVAAMSTRRSSVGVAALGGRLYAVGGYDGGARQCLASVERYDPAVDLWEPAAEMAARRSGAAVGVLGDALYAAGGHDGPAVRRSVERLVPGPAGTTPGPRWEPAPAMAHARRNAGCAAWAGRLYVVGGDDGAANLPTVEVLEPAAGAWTVLQSGMAVGRSYAGVAVLERPDRPERPAPGPGPGPGPGTGPGPGPAERGRPLIMTRADHERLLRRPP